MRKSKSSKTEAVAEPPSDIITEIPVIRKTPGKPRLRGRRNYFKIVDPDYKPDNSRVCLLTGASGQLGQEFIKKFSIDYKIIGLYNTAAKLPQPQLMVDPLFPSFPIENPEPTFLQVDLSDPNNIDRLCDSILEKYNKVDLLINAACHRDWHPLTQPGALDMMAHSFAVNVFAPIQLTVALIQKFWALQDPEENLLHKRNVVNISSTAGSYVYPDSGQAIYSASKAALNYVSHHLACELWEMGIRVNTVAPNTFPSIVSTETVLDEIIRFDTCEDTGKLVILDWRGSRIEQ